jgi:hypothetical protein
MCVGRPRVNVSGHEVKKEHMDVVSFFKLGFLASGCSHLVDRRLVSLGPFVAARLACTHDFCTTRFLFIRASSY